jgi:hypothetical protein
VPAFLKQLRKLGVGVFWDRGPDSLRKMHTYNSFLSRMLSFLAEQQGATYLYTPSVPFYLSPASKKERR